MKTPSAQQLVTVALLVHDYSWITMRPEVGIPAMTVGVSLQLYLTVSSLKMHSFEFCNQASLLFWLIGNVIWTCAEFIWDSGYPVGFLANVKFVTDIWAQPKYYPIMMYSAIAIQTTTCVALIAFYISHWARWRFRHQRTILPFASAREPLVACTSPSPALAGFAPAEAYVLVRWLPLRMYYELFTLPWVLMDTFWSYSDFLGVLKVHPSAVCLALSVFFGIAAIIICTDCVRRLCAAGQRSEAALAMAEAFWVTGNVVWMLQDSVTHWKWMEVTAIGLFAIGPCLVTYSMFVTNRDEQETCKLDEITITGESYLEAGNFIRTEACMAPEVSKKKPNSSRPFCPRRKPSRLMKKVTVLPKGLSNQTANFAQLVARLALNALGEPEKSIALLDLGIVSKRLSEWRQLLPRVQPHFSLQSHGDKKILQLLCQERCGFACVTAEEVSRVLSLGVPAEDVMFCEVHKLKTHLSYVKDKCVQLMPFDDAAELRKIAAEYPAARLLLQLALPKGSSAPFQFGASRTEWPELLALAAELGLQVVGVSLRGGTASEDALRDAREVFSLAEDCGHSMEVLDLGGIDTSRSTAFKDVASTIQEQLSRWFPLKDFAALYVIASPGRLFTSSASMLLTKVIAKEVAAPDNNYLQVNESQRMQYVLNAGLYGAFASTLADRSEPEAPVSVTPASTLTGAAARSRPPQPCCFLGPSQEKMDVVLKDAMIPELEVGEWILWPGMAVPTRSGQIAPEDKDNESQQTEVWYYTEDGNLPEA